MTMRSYTLLTGILLMAMIVSSCGNKTKREHLSADEYFDYAKQKFDNGDYLDAITEFTIITLKFSGNPVVDDAQYYLAESHFKQKDYILAVSEYQKLINDYPQSPYNILSQFKIALAYSRMALRPELDQDYRQKAIRYFQEFAEEHPDHELADEAERMITTHREALAKKLMVGARTYHKMGVHQSAIIYYDIILSDYYDTTYAAAALFYKGKAQFKRKEYKDAQISFNVFLEKYPDHEFAHEAKTQLGETSEKLKKVTLEEQANLNSADGN